MMMMKKIILVMNEYVIAITDFDGTDNVTNDLRWWQDWLGRHPWQTLISLVHNFSHRIFIYIILIILIINITDHQ